MGKGSSPVIGYWYSLTMHMGECLGPVDALLEVRMGDRQAWIGNKTTSGAIYINKPNLFGGEKQEGGLNGSLNVYMGNADQLPPPALASIEPGPRPAYRGKCTTVFDGDVAALNKYVKAISKKWARWTAGWSTPVWQPALCKIDQGMNPVHIIYQVLTDPNCGSRDPATTFNQAKMLSAAQTLYDEGFGLCLKWTTSDTIGKFVGIICDHVGAMWVEDPTSEPGAGGAYLKLIRDDYDLTTAPVLDEGNIISMLEYRQPTLADSVNEVSVTYRDPDTNKDAALAAQNLANVQAQGRVVSQDKSYPGLWNHDQAARAALRDVTVLSSLLLKLKVKVKSGGPRGLFGVKKGDVLPFSYARKDVVGMPVRVLEADYGTVSDNAITLTCAQDVFGLPQTTYLVHQPPLWTEPDLTPTPVPQQVLQEASYRDLAGYLRASDLATVGATSGYLTTLAGRPSSVAYNYTITARIGNNGTFDEVGSGAFAPTGVLTTDIGPLDTAIALTDFDALDQVQVGSEALLGAELVRVDAIDTATAQLTISRGCVDTVPVAHTAGAQIWFTDRFTGYGKTEYLASELIQARLLTNTSLGQLEPNLALAGSVTMASRQGRPYPPGNLKINGARFPATATGTLAISWSHRDRLLQADQLVDTLQTDIGPEPGTTYTVEVYLDGVLDSTAPDLTATSYTPTVSGPGSARVEVTSQRDGLDSWQAATANFTYS